MKLRQKYIQQTIRAYNQPNRLGLRFRGPQTSAHISAIQIACSAHRNNPVFSRKLLRIDKISRIPDSKGPTFQGVLILTSFLLLLVAALYGSLPGTYVPYVIFSGDRTVRLYVYWSESQLVSPGVRWISTTSWIPCGVMLAEKYTSSARSLPSRLKIDLFTTPRVLVKLVATTSGRTMITANRQYRLVTPRVGKVFESSRVDYFKHFQNLSNGRSWCWRDLRLHPEFDIKSG